MSSIFSVLDGDGTILDEWSELGTRDIDGKAARPSKRERASQYAPSNVRTEAYVQGLHGLVKTLVANVYYYQDEPWQHIARGERDRRLT